MGPVQRSQRCFILGVVERTAVSVRVDRLARLFVAFVEEGPRRLDIRSCVGTPAGEDETIDAITVSEDVLQREHAAPRLALQNERVRIEPFSDGVDLVAVVFERLPVEITGYPCRPSDRRHTDRTGRPSPPRSRDGERGEILMRKAGLVVEHQQDGVPMSETVLELRVVVEFEAALAVIDLEVLHVVIHGSDRPVHGITANAESSVRWGSG